ncbi:MAG: hypothetical protein WCK03_01920 [Candidatus Taylorbacteria bacterium]
MPDDNQTQDVTAPVVPIVPAIPPEEAKTLETSEMPVSDISSQPNGSTPTDLPLMAPESPTDAPTPVPVESDNSGLNQPESSTSEAQTGAPISEPIQPVPAQVAPSAPTPLTSPALQTQSLAQQDQVGFIHNLLIKAQAKIQFNKQKKLDNLVQFAQKKRIITNSDAQKLLRVSDRTATRYLVKLVQQGRLTRTGDPHDAKYQFVR